MPMILAAALIYGAIFPVNRIAADIGWPPLSFSFLQSLGGAVVLALVAFIKGERIGLTRSHLMAYIVIGGLVVGLPMGLLVTAAPHLDPSVLTLVLCLSPILTLFIGILLRIETFRNDHGTHRHWFDCFTANRNSRARECRLVCDFAWCPRDVRDSQ
jgi:drug/metabolite transporter (DMT)-like permease